MNEYNLPPSSREEGKQLNTVFTTVPPKHYPKHAGGVKSSYNQLDLLRGKVKAKNRKLPEEILLQPVPFQRMPIYARR